MATYRISPNEGIDSAGRSGSISEPWATWAYLDTRISPTSGDIYLQDALSIARENIPNTIIAANNITLDVYGDGGYATITGFQKITGWAYNSTYKVWQNTVVDGWNVSLNNFPLTFVAWNTDLATTAAQMPDYSFSHDTTSNLLYIKSYENPDGCEVAQKESVLGQWTSTNSSLIVRGYNITGGWRHGIYTTGKNNMLIEQCRIAQCGGDWAGSFYLGNGIEIYGTCSNVVIQDCVFEDIFDSALTPQLSSTSGQFILGLIARRNTYRRCGYAGYEGTFNGTSQSLTGLQVLDSIFENIGKNCWSGNRGGRAITFSNNASASSSVTSGCLVANNIIKNSVRGIRFVTTQGENTARGNLISDCDYGLVSYQGLNSPGHSDNFVGNVVKNCTVGYGAEGAWALTANLFNNTFIQCTTGIKNTTNSVATLIVKNNLITNSGTAFNSSTGTLTETYNNINSDTVPGKTLDGTDLTLDPQLNSAYIPQNASLLTAGTFLGGADYYLKTFTNPPPIGATQKVVTRTLTSRTIGTRTPTTKTIKLKTGIVG